MAGNFYKKFPFLYSNESKKKRQLIRENFMHSNVFFFSKFEIFKLNFKKKTIKFKFFFIKQLALNFSHSLIVIF